MNYFFVRIKVSLVVKTVTTDHITSVSIVHIKECSLPQLAFTCSNVTVETLEQDVKYVQS